MWTARLKNLSILAAVFSLQGCLASMPPSTARAPVDQSLIEPCPPLSPLADGDSKTVLRWSLATVDAYADCSSRHQRLVEAVK